MNYAEDLKKFDSFIFDLDGTLLDSMPLWNDIYLRTLARYGCAVPEDYLMKVNHLSVRAGAAYTVSALGLDATPEEVIGVWASMGERAYREDIQLKPYAAEFLKLLKGEGKTLGIATALGHGFFEPCLERNGVLSLFSAATSVEEVGKAKDSPDIYLRACQKAGSGIGGTVVFEDSVTGAGSAKRAGFCVVGVYDASADGQWEQMNRIADGCIRSYEELLRI